MNYISAEELRKIADSVESLRPLWDSLIQSNVVSLECDDLSITIYDSNGDRLGRIMWSEQGPAFYPDMES